MSDKDFLVVISEMLRKQDQQAEKLDVHSNILNQHTEILNQHTEILNQHTEILNQQTELLNQHNKILMKTNESFNNFVEVSIREFDQQRQQYQHQQQYNAQFLEALNKLNGSFTDTKEQQNLFNERFLNKLDDIEKALKK